ncbi:MAG: hypothetical protein ACRDF4_12120 [Rhabdochlamydiaceae bacterium]
MAEYRKQIVATSIVAIVLALSIGIGIYYIQPELGRTPTSSCSVSGPPGKIGSCFSTASNTTTSSPNYPTSTRITNSTLGIELSLSVNQTLIQSGQAINVSAGIFNTLHKVDNVTGASDWATPTINSAASFPCPNYLYYQVYQGYYGESNISSASSPAQTAPQESLPCLQNQRAYYLFQSLSDSASVPIGYYNTNSSVYYVSTLMAISGMLTGYYVPSFNSSGYIQDYQPPPPAFPPGTYTLAAGDEWGQLVLLHFFVTPDPTPPSASSVSTSTTRIIPTSSSVGNTSSIQNSVWDFTVYINATRIVRGQSVELIASLRNISPNNQTISQYIAPYINPQMYSPNGTGSWARDPPAVTFRNYTMTPGQILKQVVNIPTSELSSGQTCVIGVAPSSQGFLSEGNLTITMQFSVE